VSACFSAFAALAASRSAFCFALAACFFAFSASRFCFAAARVPFVFFLFTRTKAFSFRSLAAFLSSFSLALSIRLRNYPSRSEFNLRLVFWDWLDIWSG